MLVSVLHNATVVSLLAVNRAVCGVLWFVFWSTRSWTPTPALKFPQKKKMCSDCGSSLFKRMISHRRQLDQVFQLRLEDSDCVTFAVSKRDI